MANKILPRKPESGFTLLEVLIAFIIFTAAAVIILDQVYVILKYGERARAAAESVNAALNRAALMSTVEWKTVSAQIGEREIKLNYRDLESRLMELQVRNFPIDGVEVSPTVAFSPWQIFDFGGAGPLRLEMLQLGLLPAPGSSASVLGRQ